MTVQEKRRHRRYAGHVEQCAEIPADCLARVDGLAVALLAACGAPPSEPDARLQASSLADPDQAIAEALYVDRRTPPGFDREEPPGDVWYTITHVTGSHAGVPGPAYRVCAPDFDSAAALAEQAALAQPVYRDQVASRSTPLFFEFTRVHNAAPQRVQLLRVFDCNYYQPASASQARARITHRPLSAEVVRGLVEYNWWFSSANNFGHLVISSTLATSVSHFELTLRVAELSNTADACDLVDIRDERHRIGTDTGEIDTERMWQRLLRTRFDDGVATVCGN